MTISENEIDALLDQFPGPLMIGVSIPKYLFAIACGGIFIAAGIWFIQSEDTIAAVLDAPLHGPIPGEGFLRLLILLRVASDMPQAVMELGWFSLIFFGIAALFATVNLMCGVTGLRGLMLDREGFTIKALKGNSRYSWADVGDFDSLELSGVVRQNLGLMLSKSYVVFNDCRAPESPIKWLRNAGRNRALTESYEYTAKVLAPAMSIWHERALEDQASQDRQLH